MNVGRFLSVLPVAGLALQLSALPVQTDVHNAGHLFDADGVAVLDINGVGRVYNPAFVSLYALAYAGREDYFRSGVRPDADKFRKSADWLVTNLRHQDSGVDVWIYDFDSTYNDVSIKAPWYSAFGQAVGIEALLAAYGQFAEERYLSAAKAAAEALLRPIDKGGLLFQKGKMYWFEEIPRPADNPSHILNGHLRAMLAIAALHDVTHDGRYGQAFKWAAQALKDHFQLYDTGYALRYDLNPKKDELLFRINNPFNGLIPDIPIDSVKLVDPLTNESVVLDVGSAADAEGACRIAGNDWKCAETIDGRTVRRLRSLLPENPLGCADGGMASPGTYFYLSTAAKSRVDNLRSEWLELVVTYRDEVPADLVVEQRSMSPGPAFRPLRDGVLMLTGSGRWREWRIPVRPSDLGFWCGELYAEKHATYLSRIASIDPSFGAYSAKAKSYCNSCASCAVRDTAPSAPVLPKQTMVLPTYSFDGNGVLMTWMPNESTCYCNGVWDGKSPGTPGYSPYWVGNQAEGIDWRIYGFITEDDLRKIQRGPAYRWLADHARKIGRTAITWCFEYDNAYNDVETKAPWPSSFSQVYIVRALKKAVDERRTEPPLDYAGLYRKAIGGYRVPLEDGGFTSFSEYGRFYEEVPNGTHVLNAHLASMAELQKHPLAADVCKEGVATLKNSLHLFDSGYWLRYDQNPMKEIMVQIDWLSGERSPAIGGFRLVDTRTGEYVQSDLSATNAFSAVVGPGGCDWQTTETNGARVAASFDNGYAKRLEAVPGGARHNVFLRLALPNARFPEYFDVPVYRLEIDYRDMAVGSFGLKVRSICNGDALEFVPLRNGILNCCGDGRWKCAKFELRPQDLGWFVGPDYQKYVVEQLESLGSNDWFFAQYAERNRNYFEQSRLCKVEGVKVLDDSRVRFSERAHPGTDGATRYYEGYGLTNAFAEVGYTAAVEGQEDYAFSAVFSNRLTTVLADLSFESPANYARDIRVDACDSASGERVFSTTVFDNANWKFRAAFSALRPFDRLSFTFRRFAGQPRLLLRGVSVRRAVSRDTRFTQVHDLGAMKRIVKCTVDFSQVGQIPDRVLILSDEPGHNAVVWRRVDMKSQLRVEVPLQLDFRRCAVAYEGFADGAECPHASPLVEFYAERESKK